MIEGGRGGSIINVSSIEGSRAAPGYAVYAACKAGINNLRGVFWEVGSLGMTMFNTIAPPNSKQWLWGDCRNTGGGYPNDATFANTSSLHSGGVNVLMADGSVRFVKNTISSWSFSGANPVGVTLSNFIYSVAPGTQIGVWQQLSTRNLGEVVSADQY